MTFKIPFSFEDVEIQRRKVKNLKFYFKRNKDSKLHSYLSDADVNVTREEYLAICFKGAAYAFGILFVFFFASFLILGINGFWYSLLYSFLLALLFSGFMLFSRLIYPKVYCMRKQSEIERNLISALGDMLVQLNSGIPLFSILVNLSNSDYGELSREFKKAVKKINAGLPQIEVIEALGERNSSIYFKRTLWQISNGLRSGSDLAIVIQDSINSLNEEQLIQIQNYGNKLNPLIMFYMLISVILPALAITFLTIISSMIDLPEVVTILMFLGMFVFVIIIQVMFLGVIKSARPSLL